MIPRQPGGASKKMFIIVAVFFFPLLFLLRLFPSRFVPTLEIARFPYRAPKPILKSEEMPFWTPPEKWPQKSTKIKGPQKSIQMSQNGHFGHFG